MTKKKPQLEATDGIKLEKRQKCQSLEVFIETVLPKRVLGNVHRELCNWATASNASKYQLVLMPRDHGKSWWVAMRGVHALTMDPTQRILYISSTSNLASKQLKYMKDIFLSSTYRALWPEMVFEEEAKREKWTEKEISLDHPLRAEENIRDPSIFTAGLTTNIVGLHCDIAILDDVVVADNAYTEDRRQKVKEQYGYLSSIEAANAREWVVGTRYHPLDLYDDIVNLKRTIYNEYGQIEKETPMFDVFERQVESAGDGSGEFLWPRQQRSDGAWFGFDRDILRDKWNKYQNKMHFRAQYYNDPQDTDSSPIQRGLFQYYDPKYLSSRSGNWYYKDSRLNTFAAVDFAFSLGKKADSSSIVVVGVDGDKNYYVLDIDRFKTDRPSDYFDHILQLYTKWGFRKIRAEVNVAQAVLVKDLKENYIRKHGLALAIEEYRPSRWDGAKEERILAVLEPKYANLQMWHYPGGNCQILEEELMFANPAHDDVKDALASAVDFAVPPSNMFAQAKQKVKQLTYHSRWGGIV